MKNGRSLHDHHSLITKHHLSTRQPGPHTLFYKLWNASFEIAQLTLHTDFLQGIKKGNLNPIAYGAFTIRDIYYCCKGASDYGLAAKRTTDPILRDYLYAKQHSYEHYNQTLCHTWSLSNPASIQPSATIQQYSAFETSIVNGTAKEGDVRDPIFALIIMIPCEYLWAWLASQLAPPVRENIYAEWITSNNDPEGAYAMGNFLQEYISANSIDEQLAIRLYQKAIEYEYRNFHEAAGRRD
jgi:thiaminase/transcriptional activator TenA